MSKAIHNLFEIRKSLERFEQEVGISNLSDLEKSIIEFVASSKEVTLTVITQTEYFQKYSLSSIKRAVSNLIESNIVFQEISKGDRRARFLVFKD